MGFDEDKQRLSKLAPAASKYAYLCLIAIVSVGMIGPGTAVAALFSDQAIGSVEFDRQTEACRFPDLGPGVFGFNLRTGVAFQRVVSTHVDGLPPETELREIPKGLASVLSAKCSHARTDDALLQAEQRQQRLTSLREQALAALMPVTHEGRTGQQTSSGLIRLDGPVLLSELVGGTVFDAPPGEVTALSGRSDGESLPFPVTPELAIVDQKGLDADTLERAIAAALADARTLEVAHLKLDAARSAVSVRQREEGATTIGLRAQAGLEETPSQTPLLRANAETGVTLVMPILDGGRAAIRTAIEQHRVSLRRADLIEARGQIARSVRATYWALAVSEHHRRALAAWVDPMAQWLNKAKRLLAERLITQRDFLALEAADTELTIRLRELDLDIEALALGWRELTDRDPPVWPATFSPRPVEVPWGGVADMESAVNGMAVVLRAEIAVNEAKDRLAQARLANAGQLDFRGDAEVDAYSETDVFIGLRYDVPLYDSGIAEAQIREQAADLRAASAELDLVRDESRRSLNAAVLSLKRERLEIDNALVRAAATHKGVQDSIRLFEELPDRLSGLTGAIRGHLAALGAVSRAFGAYRAEENDALALMDSTVPGVSR